MITPQWLQDRVSEAERAYMLGDIDLADKLLRPYCRGHQRYDNRIIGLEAKIVDALIARDLAK